MNRLFANPLVMRVITVVERKIGLAELASRLDTTEDSLRAWRDGQANMPERKFLELVDVLTQLDPSWTEWNAE